jgi:hypothetical protein
VAGFQKQYFEIINNSDINNQNEEKANPKWLHSIACSLFFRDIEQYDRYADTRGSLN